MTHTQLKKADNSKLYPIIDMQDIYDKVYPVGCLYWSSNNTNPSKLFGGTWESIENRFIWAMGNTETDVNSTGGSSSVTLSQKNLPSHSHSINGHSHTMSHTHNMEHYHTRGEMEIHGNVGAVGVGDYWTAAICDGPFNPHTYVGQTSGKSQDFYATDFYASRNNSWTERTSNSLYWDLFTRTDTGGASSGTTGWLPSSTTGDAGSGESFNITPPYIKKYCWERIG